MKLKSKNLLADQLNDPLSSKIAAETLSYTKLLNQQTCITDISPSTTVDTPNDIYSSPKTSGLFPRGPRLGEEDISPLPSQRLNGRRQVHQQFAYPFPVERSFHSLAPVGLGRYRTSRTSPLVHGRFLLRLQVPS